VAESEWDEIGRFSREDFVISLPWTVLIESIGRATYLHFSASGDWKLPVSDERCGPDGRIDLVISADRLVIPEAPVGALIGKLGGSSAHRSDGTLFAIGAVCIIKIPDGIVGPLFLSLNGARPGSGDRITSLNVVVSGARPEP
jgi:hypothetical protein